MNGDFTYDAIKCYTFPIAPDAEGNLRITGPATDPHPKETSVLTHTDADIRELRLQLRMAAGRIVDQRARWYMEDHSEKSYRCAMNAVLDADAPLKAKYALGVTADEFRGSKA